MKKNNLFKTAALLLMMALPMLAATNVKAQGGTSCETATVLTGTSSSILADYSQEYTYSLYYSFTPATSGAYVISNCGKTTDNTSLSLFSGSCTDPESPNTKSTDCGDQHSVVFLAQAGTTYYIAWYNHSSVRNNFNWSLTATSAEGLFCETPIVLSGTSNNIAALFTDKQSDDLYYSFTPTTAGYYTARMAGSIAQSVSMDVSNTCNYEDEIAVGIGNVTFYAQAGTTYHIMFRCMEDLILANGTWSLQVESTPAMLTCQTAQTATLGNNISAPHADKNSSVLWYSFTPTQTGAYKATSNAAAGNTQFVLLGDCEDFEFQIAYGEDAMPFYVESGTTYYILAAAFNGNINYTWNLQLDANPEGSHCQTPIALPGTSSSILAPHATKQKEGIWYTFTPQTTATYTVSNCGNRPENSYTYPYVYKGTCSNFTKISTQPESSCSEYDGNKVSFLGEAGTTYYINWEMYMDDDEALVNYNWTLSKEEGAINYATSVNIYADSIEVDVNDSYYLSFSTEPSYGVYSDISWQVLNPAIARIDTDERDVVGLAPGTTYVVVTITTPTATFKDSCKVTVIGEFVACNGIKITPKTRSLEMGNNANLSVAALPMGALLPTLQWTSRNTGIATVDNTGKVTAVAAGNTYIVATSTTGSYKDSCLVTVSQTTGISTVKPKTTTLKVYPNPVGNEELTIKNEEWKQFNNSTIQQLNIALFDLAGKCVATYPVAGETTKINISQLPRGTYLVKVGVQTIKIVKQ